MKKFAFVVFLAVVAVVGYQYSQTGSLPFLSSGPASVEERQLEDLFDRFATARSQFKQAGRSAGMTGLDTTAGADAAISEVKRIKTALDRLTSKLSSDEARRKASQLAEEIKNFQARLR